MFGLRLFELDFNPRLSQIHLDQSQRGRWELAIRPSASPLNGHETCCVFGAYVMLRTVRLAVARSDLYKIKNKKLDLFSVDFSFGHNSQNRTAASQLFDKGRVTKTQWFSSLWKCKHSAHDFLGWNMSCWELCWRCCCARAAEACVVVRAQSCATWLNVCITATHEYTLAVSFFKTKTAVIVHRCIYSTVNCITDNRRQCGLLCVYVTSVFFWMVLCCC